MSYSQPEQPPFSSNEKLLPGSRRETQREKKQTTQTPNPKRPQNLKTEMDSGHWVIDSNISSASVYRLKKSVNINSAFN